MTTKCHGYIIGDKSDEGQDAPSRVEMRNPKSKVNIYPGEFKKGGIFKMSIAFSGSELVNIAIGIERRGVTFYDTMAKSTKNVTARDVFQNLANMEREHIRIFQNMLTEAEKYQIPETYAEEYEAYLQALVDNAIFTDDFITSEMATKAGSDIKALELAISAEKDSILFYYGMKEITPQRAQLAVSKILAEEKSHLRQLSELKKGLADI